MTDATTLASALAQLQAALPDVRKGNTATVPTKSGGKYSYSYADLADCTHAIMPHLAEVGLSFSAKPMLTDDGRFVLRYVLRHTSGEDDGGDYPLPDPARATAQEVGSAITYARRYSLTAVTGMAPGGDDDDGQAASRPHHDEEEPAPVDPATELRIRIARLGAAKGKTPVETADDFTSWAQGTAIGSASPELLASYVTAINEGTALT